MGIYGAASRYGSIFFYFCAALCFGKPSQEGVACALRFAERTEVVRKAVVYVVYLGAALSVKRYDRVRHVPNSIKRYFSSVCGSEHIYRIIGGKGCARASWVGIPAYKDLAVVVDKSVAVKLFRLGIF